MFEISIFAPFLSIETPRPTNISQMPSNTSVSDHDPLKIAGKVLEYRSGIEVKNR
jgi:hypothetical protein